MNALVILLAAGMSKDRKRIECRFQQIVDVCYNNELFTWALEGKVLRETPADGGEEVETFECNSKSASRLGRILSDKMCGRDFRLADNTTVRFEKQGRLRHRRYLLDRA
jgi:hypothetical protein